MLLDKTYFVGEINIPNTSNQSVLERLNFFIAKYEEQLLRALLGDGLYKAYTDGLAANDPKYIAIRDGKDYTDSNAKAYNWMGLRKESTKQSLIANYVYYWWLRDKVSITTGVGEADVKTDSADKISPAAKMTKAWNEMVEWNRSLMFFLDINKDDYPQWDRACVIHNNYSVLSPINSFNI